MSILKDNANKYSLSQVDTSLNYGKPLSVIQRRVVQALSIVLYVCCAAIVVAAIVCICLGQYGDGRLWYFGGVFLLIVGVVCLVKWATFRREKNDSLIKDCFNDAVEVDACIEYEPYLFDNGENLLSYVAHFYINDVEYAVTYANPVVNPVDSRPDLTFYRSKFFKALYSSKHNDVIFLNQMPNDNGEIE